MTNNSGTWSGLDNSTDPLVGYYLRTNKGREYRKHWIRIVSISLFHFILFFFRERENMSIFRGTQRESQVGSMPSVEPHVGLNLITLSSQPEVKSRVSRSTD